MGAPRKYPLELRDRAVRLVFESGQDRQQPNPGCQIKEPLRNPGSFSAWLERFAGQDAHFALEGTTGWRFVVEEIERAGHTAYLADPAETASKRGRKRRAKTDDADCDLQLRLLLAGELPESWIPPAPILELRTRVRLRKTLIDQRTAWLQRLQAQLFHQGAPSGPKPRTLAGRRALAAVELSASGRELVELALRMLDMIDRELGPLDHALQAYARRQPGCRALITRLYGVGAVTATATLAELGDTRRFTSSDDPVRHAGLDVTVWQSDRKRAPGHLSHQGPALLRWALFEAAQCAARRSSPDHAYYLEVTKRLDHNRACLSVARKLCRRAHHTLRDLGDDALATVDDTPATNHVESAAA